MKKTHVKWGQQKGASSKEKNKYEIYNVETNWR